MSPRTTVRSAPRTRTTSRPDLATVTSGGCSKTSANGCTIGRSLGGGRPVERRVSFIAIHGKQLDDQVEAVVVRVVLDPVRAKVVDLVGATTA